MGACVNGRAMKRGSTDPKWSVFVTYVTVGLCLATGHCGPVLPGVRQDRNRHPLTFVLKIAGIPAIRASMSVRA